MKVSKLLQFEWMNSCAVILTFASVSIVAIAFLLVWTLASAEQLDFSAREGKGVVIARNFRPADTVRVISWIRGMPRTVKVCQPNTYDLDIEFKGRLCTIKVPERIYKAIKVKDSIEIEYVDIFKSRLKGTVQ